ncbi:UNVERIFIED_CONTAM: hypothetical protein Cloal_1698 [Acetivibrio alkalicellulosi]
MAKKKRFKGHYCKVCDSYIANERFSGKGHARHICKKCSKLPIEEQHEQINLNRIFSLYRYSNLSKVNRIKLEKFLGNKSKKVREAAREMLDEFTGKSRYKIMEDEEYEYEEFMLSNLEDYEFVKQLEDDCYLDDTEGNYIEDDELPF